MQKERKRKRDVPIILSSLLSRQKPRMPLPSQISFFAAVLLTSCIDFVGTPLHSRHMPDTPINYNSDSDQPFSASTLQLSFPDDDLSEPKPYRLILYSYDILIISETFQQSRSQRARPRGPETSEKNKRTLPNSVSGHRTLSFLPITQSMSRLAPIPCTSKATSLLLYSTLNVLACTQMREREKNKQRLSLSFTIHSLKQPKPPISSHSCTRSGPCPSEFLPHFITPNHVPNTAIFPPVTYPCHLLVSNHLYPSAYS